MDLSNPVASGLPGGFIELQTPSNQYLAVLPSEPTKYRLDAEVVGGELVFTIKTPNTGVRGVGTALFGLMWQKHGSQVNVIRSCWVAGDPATPEDNLDTNLMQFLAAYQIYRTGGMGVLDSQLRAALDDTWTGKRAKGLGFSKVAVGRTVGSEGAWWTVELLFFN